MERYFPDMKDFAPREAQCKAITREVREGRGTRHGGVYLSVRHLPRNLISEYLDGQEYVPFFSKLKEGGFDIYVDGLEVGPAAHYVQGGCWIDEKCHTNLQGLYAIGEVGSGGKDGADRLAGNSLTFCFAMGIIAGYEAAQQVKNIEYPRIDAKEVEGLITRSCVCMERSSGMRPVQVKEKIRRMLSQNAVYDRNKEGLENAIREMEKIKVEDIPRIYCKAKSQRFNMEWVEALEAENMAVAAEGVLRAALMRTESRGLHDRVDFPDEDPAWQKHIIIEKKNGDMTLNVE
jgi:succinate dehydrogenase/fumarate reductase flavoprotein subunit